MRTVLYNCIVKPIKLFSLIKEFSYNVATFPEAPNFKFQLYNATIA